MWGHKNKKIKTIPNEKIEEGIHQELIVHNMPSQDKSVGRTGVNSKNTQLNQSFKAIEPIKSSSKMIGALIIGVGLIIVVVAIYFGYSYIIKPTANNNQTTVAIGTKEKINSKSNQLALTTKIIDVASTTSIIKEVPTSTIKDIVASSSTENKEKMDKTLIKKPILSSLLDDDKDGLNNNEEKVFNTNINLADSDSDGYTDLAEIDNGYNPDGNGHLEEDQNITVYENKKIGYQALYPVTWKQETLNNGRTVVFAAPDNSLIQISVQTNPKSQSILDWYKKSFPEVTVSYDKLENRNDWSGLMGPNKLNFYLTNKTRDNIYIISYIPVIDDQVIYPTVFKMMINSLIIN